MLQEEVDVGLVEEEISDVRALGGEDLFEGEREDGLGLGHVAEGAAGAGGLEGVELGPEERVQGLPRSVEERGL